MATASSSAKSNGSAPTADDLARQIEALKDDIAGIARTLGAMGAAQGEAAAAAARSTAQGLKANGAAALDAAAERAGAAATGATEAVRQNPGLALGLAMGLGFLVGYLTARR
jgi:ElaB/YqjD/DUF883 family membrane-anchored ribosome-binding protein